MMTSPRCIILMLNKLFCLVFLFCAFSCSADEPPVPDAEQPVNIQADNANLDNEKGIALYLGNVTVDQGSRHLSADKLTIHRDTNNKVKIMIATGNPATFHSQSDPQKPAGSGKAKTIKYYPQQNMVDLLGEAELTQDGDTIKGPILNYNFTTGNLNSKSTEAGRTTFILQPKKRES
jgi:lipopolysaccharide export system protein LptA